MNDTGKTKISKANVAIITILAILFIIAFGSIYMADRAGLRAVGKIELASEYVQKVESTKEALVDALYKRDQKIVIMKHQDSLKNTELEKALIEKKYLQLQLRNRDEKIDSLHAVINSFQQSDI